MSPCLKNKQGAREIAQQLKVLAALAEVPGSIPSTHMMLTTIGNYSFRDLMPTFDLCRH